MFLISSSVKSKKQQLNKLSINLTYKQKQGTIKEREIHFYGNINIETYPILDRIFDNFDVIGHDNIPINLIERKNNKEDIYVVVKKDEQQSIKCLLSKYERVHVVHLTDAGFLKIDYPL